MLELKAAHAQEALTVGFYDHCILIILLFDCFYFEMSCPTQVDNLFMCIIYCLYLVETD